MKNNCQSQKCSHTEPRLKPTDEIYYSGEHLPHLGINTGDILTGVLKKIDEALSVMPGESYDLIRAGNHTLFGDGLKISFTFPHNLGAMPDGVCVVASNKNNMHNFKTEFNSLVITVTYSIAPGAGETLNWSYIAVKNK